jgi:hypothetical protein
VVKQPLIETVARPEHQPVLAKLNRLLIAIDGAVLDCKNRHGARQQIG